MCGVGRALPAWPCLVFWMNRAGVDALIPMAHAFLFRRKRLDSGVEPIAADSLHPPEPHIPVRTLVCLSHKRSPAACETDLYASLRTWFSLLAGCVVIQLRRKTCAPPFASKPIRRASGTNFVRQAGKERNARNKKS